MCQFSGVVWGYLGVPSSLSGGLPGQNYFVIILRCHLLFSPPFCHGRTVEYFGDQSACEKFVALMTNRTCAVYSWALNFFQF